MFEFAVCTTFVRGYRAIHHRNSVTNTVILSPQETFLLVPAGRSKRNGVINTLYGHMWSR